MFITPFYLRMQGRIRKHGLRWEESFMEIESNKHLVCPGNILKSMLFLLATAWLMSCGGRYKNPEHTVVLEEEGQYQSFPSIPPLLIPGEELRYNLSLRGIVGGQATVSVGQPTEHHGHKGIPLHSTVETVGIVAFVKEIRDDILAWVDIETGLPFDSVASVKFGSKEALVQTRFADGKGGSFAFDYERKGRSNIRLKQSMPKDRFAQDIHGAMGVFRAWDVPDNHQGEMHLLSGRRLWRGRFKVTRNQKIKLPFGKFKAIRVDGIAQKISLSFKENNTKKPRYFSVWISEDQNRLPLLVLAKTEYGDVRVELVEYIRHEADDL